MRVTHKPWFKMILELTADGGRTAKQMVAAIEGATGERHYAPDFITKLRNAAGVEVKVIGDVTRHKGYIEKLYRIDCPGEGLNTSECPLCGSPTRNGYGMMGGGCGPYVYCTSGDDCRWMYKEQDTEGMEDDDGDQDGEEQGQRQGLAPDGEASDDVEVSDMRGGGLHEPVRGPDARADEAPGSADGQAACAGAAALPGDGRPAKDELAERCTGQACPRCGAFAAINCSIEGCPNR
jgi:hypothetical protein